MRIVFLAPFGIRPKGTLQARMLPLAAALQRRGHELTVVAPPYTNPEDAGLVELAEGVEVRNVALGPAAGALAAPFIAGRMLREALERKPDLVHLFKPKGYGGLAALLLLAMPPLGLQAPPLLVDSDDREGTGGMNDRLPYSGPEKWLFSFQERFLTRHGAAVTVASRALESLAWSMGARPERTLYLPNGPVTRPAGNRQRGRERFGIGPQTPLLLLYTRFFECVSPRLHELAARICRRLPEVKLLVVGKGPNGEEQALEQAAIRGGFHKNLLMAGWLEPDRLPDCLAAADAALYPFDDTLVNRTKCPAKLAELAAAGIAVAAERVGQINDYLLHNESALLVEPGDPEGLAAAACLLLSDRDLARRLGDNAARRMAGLFSWEVAAERLEALYITVRREVRP
ncbi:glycosyltransferase [Trichlorobacter ammonificans]|uniref:Glycosyltransferase involved in cell wall biosynthesis n=1 Tax=Trichlorobacter ammonificans TaxID=2916410 RepID=A0ABN8HC59_9BACT|nr:glycosyltransferase [Trichlorobacter ammonificans]CAH2030185.1 Glycosyltransferase involved in cell wall biosynthesis [Trichlorobacter ammonificans]